MSRDPLIDDPGPAEGAGAVGGGQRGPGGGVGTTDPRLLVALALVGLVAGWAMRPLAVELDRVAPRVGWVQVGALFLVAAILGSVAWFTRRDPPRLSASHQAVNRLVLAKACALVGALAVGGYLGIALSWVGIDAVTAGPRIVRSLAAAVAALATVVASLLLERACRIGSDEPEP